MMNIDVVSIEMGYGHLRAAYPLADALGVPVQLADEAPLADETDRKLWGWIRRVHGLLSRPTPWAPLERPANTIMDWVTMIPSLNEQSDQSAPDVGAIALDHLIERGLGRGLVRALRERKSTLLTTFYAPAIIADKAGYGPVYCVVTDADVQRIWVARKPEKSSIHYFAPSTRVKNKSCKPIIKILRLGSLYSKVSLTTVEKSFPQVLKKALSVTIIKCFFARVIPT